MLIQHQTHIWSVIQKGGNLTNSYSGNHEKTLAARNSLTNQVEVKFGVKRI